MEKFLLHCAKIVGTPTGTSASWVHTFSPQEEERLEKRGHLLAVIGLTEFSGGSEIAVIGKEIISRLHEEYYGERESSAFDRLKESLAKVTQEFKEGVDFKLDIGAVSVVGDVLYAMVNNGSKLMINRQDQIRTILSENEILSGYLQEGDVFLLGTGEFFRLIKEEILFSALNASSPEEAVEILAPVIHGQTDGGAAAVVFKFFKKEQDLKKEKPPAFSIAPQIKKEKKNFLFLARLKNNLSDFIINLDEKIKKQLIFLRSNKEKSTRSQKTLMTVALILFFILIISVFFGMKQRKNSGLTKEAAVLLEQAKTKKEEGETLLSLNPAKARQLLLEAQGLVKKIDQTGTKNEEFRQFKNELETILASFLQEHQVEGESFFDLEIIKDKALGDRFVLFGEQIVVLDKNQNSIYALGLGGEKSTILAGGEKIAGVNLLTNLNKNLYVLANEGLYKLNKNPELKIKKDEEWGLVIDMVGFDNNLYFLSSEGIWKYVLTDEVFASKQRWLKQEVDLSGSLKMAIDGSIWVLTKNGQILKLTRGVKENFVLTGLTKPLLNPSSFYTHSDLKNLYILDKANSRILVVNKLGEFQKEYLWPKINEANDLLVDAQEEKVFLLLGSKIYTINLK